MMKTINRIRNVQWSAAWTATKIVLILFGAIALSAWLVQPLAWYLLTASVLAVAGAWALTFRLVEAVEARRTQREAAEERRRIDTSIARIRRGKESLEQAHMRRRFVRFDPESGEEVYKFEPAN